MLGLKLGDFLAKKDSLFEEADLKFEPRENNKMDKKIAIILKIMKITDVPVINLKDDLFLIGLYKFNLEIKGDFVSLQVGSTNQRIADYIKDNREFFKNKLAILSLKNQNVPIIEVVNRLIHKE